MVSLYVQAVGQSYFSLKYNHQAMKVKVGCAQLALASLKPRLPNNARVFYNYFAAGLYLLPMVEFYINRINHLSKVVRS